MDKKYYYKGAVHIHTIFSDGSEDVRSIAKSAKKAGLDFIIITDHNNFEAKEGIIEGVLVIKGEEISPLNKKNHYLAFDIKELILPDEDPKKNVENVKAQGGFGFAAHPFDGRGGKRKNSYPPIFWTDEEVIPDGVEIWNYFSSWGEKYNDKNIFTKACAYFFKNCFVKAPDNLSIEWWDKLNRQSEKIIPALMGVDAHALKYRDIIPVTVFDYLPMFKTLTNAIILNNPLEGDFKKQKQDVLNALKNASCVMFNQYVSKNIPEIYISNRDKKAYSGEKINLDDETYLNIKTKGKYLLKIIYNGEELYHFQTDCCRMLIDRTGKYRIEIYKKDRGYAFSNPIVVL